MATLVIQISGGTRFQSQIQRIDTFPFRIGRAYDNDLILTDDTVSPYHLLITQNEEGVSVRNLSTENGTSLEQESLEDQKLITDLPVNLTLGHTEVRLLSSDEAVKPTREISGLSQLSNTFSKLSTALILLFSYFLLTAYYAFERQSIVRDFGEIIVGQFVEFSSPLLIALVTGFICRLLIHQWRFFLQISIASLAFIFFLLMNEVTNFLSYLFTSREIGIWAGRILPMIVLSILLTWQLRAFSHLSLRRATLTGVALVCTYFGVSMLRSYVNQPEFSGAAPMHRVLRSVDIRLQDTETSIPTVTANIHDELRKGLDEELEKFAL